MRFTISSAQLLSIIVTTCLAASAANLQAQNFAFSSNVRSGQGFQTNQQFGRRFQNERPQFDTTIFNRTQAVLTISVDGDRKGTLRPGKGWRTQMRRNALVHVSVGPQFKQFRITQDPMEVNIGNFGWQQQQTAPSTGGIGGDFGRGAGNGTGIGVESGNSGGNFGDDNPSNGVGGTFDGEGFAGGNNVGGRVSQAQLQREARQVLTRINRQRAQHGLPAIRWDNTLAQVAQERANSMAHKATTMFDLFAATEHINMNAKVRAAGYPLPPYMVDNANDVESTWGTGGQPLVTTGSGNELVNAFLGEGPAGGHYQAIMNPNAQDMAAAFAINARGDSIVACVLVVSPL